VALPDARCAASKRQRCPQRALRCDQPYRSPLTPRAPQAYIMDTNEEERAKGKTVEARACCACAELCCMQGSALTRA
jgi:hypothetical protein